MVVRFFVFSLFMVGVFANISAQNFTERIHLGVYGGANFTWAIPLERKAIVNNNIQSADKTYALPFANVGMQIGILGRVDILPNLVLSVEPEYISYVHKYSNLYSWEGAETVDYELEYRHKRSFVDVPVFIEFRRPARLQPYAKVGAYTGFLLGAETELNTRLANSQLGADVTTVAEVSSSSAFVQLQYGLAAGVGLRYAFGRTYVGVDFTYKFPLSKVSNTATEYANRELSSGFYDVADAMLVQNFAFSIQLIAPFYRDNCGADSGKPRKNR